MNFMQAVNNARLLKTLSAYGLMGAYEYINRPEFATNLPYHNTKHCLVVARWCHDLAVLDPQIASYQMRVLLLAAMFHDFGHTGKRPDSNNIEIACAGFIEYAKSVAWITETDKYEQQRINFRFVEDVTDLIRVTEFPFVREPKSALECIIRDADLLQSLEPDHCEVILEGLRSELSNMNGTLISVPEMCKAQMKFLSECKFYNNRAESIFKTALPTVEQSFKDYTANVVAQHEALNMLKDI